MSNYLTKSRASITYSLGIIAWFLFTGAARCAAQTTDARTHPDVSVLLKQLKDDREGVSGKAFDELLEIGQPAVLSLSLFLKKEDGCRPRVLAAEVLIELAPDSEAIVPSMLDVIRNPCYWSPEKDLEIRRRAAFALVATPAGVRALSELLKSKSSFVRRSAIFPFDDLTETLQWKSPSIIKAVKDALPSIIEARKDKDKIVREVAEEVIEQVDGCPIEELRNEVKRLLGR